MAQRKKMFEAVVHGIFLLLGLITVGCVLLITVYLIISGIPAIREIGLVKFLFGPVWDSNAAEPQFGILPFILTSVYGTAGALLLGVPVGLMTAIFLAKAAPPRLAAMIRTAVQLLAGIPSVVYGLVGMIVLVPAIRNLFHLSSGACLLAAMIVLAIMILPSIINVSETALRAVPKEYEEASLALGAAEMETYFRVSLHAARSGIAAAVVLLPELVPYAMGRLSSWRDPFADPLGEGHQTIQSLYAIASGGAAGLGLGNSRQKYLYVPEPQNDFIFAVVVEELGLVGALMILLIFALLVWRGITLSLRAKDKFGKLLGIGLTSQIGIQVVLNILVITDWLPNTGISLPFFSYGSSLIMLLAQMGLVLSISRTANIERQ